MHICISRVSIKTINIKVDDHTAGSWFNHGTQYRPATQLLSLEYSFGCTINLPQMGPMIAFSTHPRRIISVDINMPGRPINAEGMSTHA